MPAHGHRSYPLLQVGKRVFTCTTTPPGKRTSARFGLGEDPNPKNNSGHQRWGAFLRCSLTA